MERWAVFCDAVVEEADLAPEIREGRAPLSTGPGGLVAAHGAPGAGAAHTAPGAPASDDVPGVVALAEVVESAERAAVTAALEACDHNLSRAARALRIDRNTLKRKMASYGLRERR